VSGTPGERAPALGPARAVIAAAATGFAVMAAELTAVRLLAPHFGDSAYVWTNVIGVILAAMALGAVLGGRLSNRANALAWPGRLLLIAGCLLLAAPFVARFLGDVLLPDDLPLDVAMPALIRGSLVATALVFAPPLMLLAGVSPLLIVLVAKSGRSVGRAAGDIAAAGTIGSLVGTFLATHWLVPGFGCRVAMTIAAVVLLLAAALVAPSRQRGVAAGAVVLGLLLPLAHQGPLRAGSKEVTLLAERETPYQFLQVLRSESVGEPARTRLVINEGLDSYHSLMIEGSALTGGAYYDWHAIAPFFATDGGPTAGTRVLSIGDAAGTLRQVYAAVHPGVVVDAVDIDVETMALGDEFFTLPKASGARYTVDGRVFLEQSPDRWQVIHVDAYAHQVYVPAHLASIEFFQAAYDHLEEGGVLACNVGAITMDDAVLAAVASTVRAVFDEVQVLLIPGTRNALLLARRGKPLTPAGLPVATASDAALAGEDRGAWREILTTCQSADNWHRWPADKGPVLCDDQPLLDELLFESYVEDTDPNIVVACAGQRGASEVEQTAYEAFQARDWQRVLREVASCREGTPWLRQLAGDARWHRRELGSAVLEYEAGLASPALSSDREDVLRQALLARVQAAREQLQPVEAAAAAASRNGWLAGAIALLGLVAIWMLRRS